MILGFFEYLADTLNSRFLEHTKKRLVERIKNVFKIHFWGDEWWIKGSFTSRTIYYLDHGLIIICINI